MMMARPLGVTGGSSNATRSKLEAFEVRSSNGSKSKLERVEVRSSF